jgi:hypothetical protein
MQLLYPRKNGTGSAVHGKLVPDYLVDKFLKQGFSRTPDITNEKAAEVFFNQKLDLAQGQLKGEVDKLASDKAEFEKLKAEFFAKQNETTTVSSTETNSETKIDGRSKEGKAAKQV